MSDDDRKPTRDPVTGVDMSPEAIDRRLRDLGQLYRVGRELANARYLGKVSDPAEPPGTSGR